ncbi:family 2 glycosyl transferase [Paenibacillus alvei TS-15]|uniref:Family 2 glycosyl transferase n=1 Tax=Paenibacillus alvei TS-15 TaxID=1117108 RepID=S9U092_PAEAL|nr:glycosyltransferase family 2 protein [Paenibacillus alvei]EPY07901.1 family 2 glycosyl transferase [Paenibacillus alvei TS-15]
MFISVVIPVYNSEESLNQLYDRLTNVLIRYNDYEIILIDDNSHDSSYEIMKQLRLLDHRVHIIRHMRNFGQHNAIMCGLNYAQGDYIVTMDDDLQNPPEEIPNLLSKIQEGFDVVIGKPFEKKHAAYRNFGSYLIGKSFEKIFRKPVDLKMSSFRIISKRIVEQLVLYKGPNPMIDALILSNTLNIVNKDVRHDEREFGKSNYSIRKSISLAMDLLVNYSTIPLKFISSSGFLFALIGLFIATYAFLGKIFSFVNIAGWASIVSLISFFSGIIMISFGITGEYLIRIIGQTSQQRQFIIRESSYLETETKKEVTHVGQYR